MYNVFFFLNVVPDASVDQKEYTGKKEMERKVPAFYISNKRQEDSRFFGQLKRFASNFNSIHFCMMNTILFQTDFH